MGLLNNIRRALGEGFSPEVPPGMSGWVRDYQIMRKSGNVRDASKLRDAIDAEIERLGLDRDAVYGKAPEDPAAKGFPSEGSRPAKNKDFHGWKDENPPMRGDRNKAQSKKRNREKFYGEETERPYEFHGYWVVPVKTNPFTGKPGWGVAHAPDAVPIDRDCETPEEAERMILSGDIRRMESKKRNREKFYGEATASNPDILEEPGDGASAREDAKQKKDLQCERFLHLFEDPLYPMATRGAERPYSPAANGYPEPEDTCRCGSGLSAEWEYDAQGIPLVKVCPRCRKKELSRFRPEILSGYDQSDVDEPIDPEDGSYWESSEPSYPDGYYEPKANPSDHGYLALYKGRRVALYASNLYAARVRAEELLHVPDKQSHMMIIMPVERPDGTTIIHTPDF